ncbi:Vegetative incompatibility protein HET-E-1 like [Verticillium longisporum]|nr:Vegetative incompatibility protein HET-E-1 like [Verticillium longisporum]
MYLLHIKPHPRDPHTNPSFKLEFFQDNFPPYAILSHRWGSSSDEVTFQEIQTEDEAAKSKKGYAKIQACCTRALDYHLQYAWIDTCCIDKSSSAELSEAINSMYAWYEASTICFAYLDDVPMAGSIELHAANSPFRQSAWFTRGWTLQELIAPAEVYFISNTWSRSYLGSKTLIASLLEEITGVEAEILRNRDKLHDASVGARMSWASRRVTTRIEDEAYSLMGIFGVCMPAIYGEGRKAFHRLQDEIMRTNPDHTIFAWSMPHDLPCPEDIGMLAPSPRMFRNFSGRRVVDYKTFVNTFPHSTNRMKPDFSITNFGLHIHLPLMKLDEFFEAD